MKKWTIILGITLLILILVITLIPKEFLKREGSKDPNLFSIQDSAIISLDSSINVSNRTYIDYLRKTSILRKSNGLPTNLRKYVSYNATDKRLIIEDKNYNTLLDMQLLTPYDNKVAEGSDTLIAAFLLRDFNKTITKYIENIDSYDVRKGYKNLNKRYTFKYGVKWRHEVCYPEGQNNTLCENITTINWTKINKLTDTPKKNLLIGVFSNTTFGEKTEFVPSILGFKIWQWATYDVTAGTTHKIENTLGYYNSMAAMNQTHYLDVYAASGNDGFARVVEFNLSDNSLKNYSSLEFDTVSNQYNSLVYINNGYFLNTYAGSGNDGFAVVLKINSDMTVSSISSVEFDTSNGQYNSLVKINDTHYLNTYTGASADGFAVVLKVDPSTYTVSKVGSALEFDTTNGQYNSLVKMNNTHYINTYRGTGGYGYAVLLKVDPDTLAISKLGSSYAFGDNTNTKWNSLEKIDDTHFLNAFAGAGADGYIEVLEVDWSSSSITNYSSLEFDTVQGQHNSLVKIVNTRFIDTYRGSGGNGYARVFDVLGNYTVVGYTPTTFVAHSTLYNSLVKVNNSLYLNAYADAATASSGGYVIPLSVELALEDYNTPPIITNQVLNATSASNLTSDNLTVWLTTQDNESNGVVEMNTWEVNGKYYTLLYYPMNFDESALGGEIKDYTRNQFNGTLTGGSWVSDGWSLSEGDKINTSLIDDGNISNSSFSVSFEARASAASGTDSKQYFISSMSSSKGFGIYLDVLGGEVYGEVGNGTLCNVAGSGWVNLNNYYYTLTYDGTTLKIYKDGALVNSSTCPGGYHTSGKNVIIGMDSDGSNRLNGQRIKSVEIYNGTLSAEQISYNYNGGSGIKTDKIVSDATNSGEVWQVYSTVDDSLTYGESQLSDSITIAGATDSCTYSSGDWVVNCADDCSISSPIDVGGNNIFITGTGTFTTSADISNYGTLHIEGTDSSNICQVTCNGGCFAK